MSTLFRCQRSYREMIVQSLGQPVIEMPTLCITEIKSDMLVSTLTQNNPLIDNEIVRRTQDVFVQFDRKRK